jgi:hypothetical protein
VSGAQPSTLTPLITGFMSARVVHVAAQLGLADRLADGPKNAEVLASETEAHAPSLHRLLRALASLGLVDEKESGRFALTPLGEQLRTGVPGSQRNLALMIGGERAWRCWGELLHCVRTGESAMHHLYGMGDFELLATLPEEAAIFNEAMAEITREVARAVVATYDFAPFREIVDVGGGNGTLIATILASAPSLRGAVFDLPTGNADALRQLAAAGVVERCQVIAGDFFQSVPSGADAYILKNIIHDWDDDRSVAILRNCRNAMAAAGKLLLVERIMPTRMEAVPSHQRMAIVDMNMMVMPGGRERTESDYRTLLAASGFTLSRILQLKAVSAHGDTSVIEAIRS